MRGSFLTACLVLAVGVTAAGPRAQTSGELPPPSRLIQRPVVVLEARALTADRLDEPERPDFVVDPARGGGTKMVLEWPGPDQRATLTLRARALRSPGTDDGHRVTLDAALELPDGEQVKSQRLFDVVEGTSTLFEVHRADGRVLTLAIQARIEIQAVLPGAPRVGARVQFDLQIQRVVEGTVVPLETNRLNTFMGEPVSYSFKLGPTGVGDAARITLRPLSLAGDVVEIEVAINGSLPGPSGPEFVARTEQWYATRDATTTAAFETGEPPTGYRFLVTPRF